MKFTAGRVQFGRRLQAGLEDEIPAPTVVKATAKRLAMLYEAEGVLHHLPGPGEALHAIMTGRYDLMHLLVVLIDRVGPVKLLRVATLSYNGRNLAEMVRLLDAGKVESITLLCSSFFRDHNKKLWETTLEEFRNRGSRSAASRSHCKVVTLETTAGDKYALEGSPNLRSNSNWEQFALYHDHALADWHARWIDELVNKHAAQADEPVAEKA